MKKEKSNQKKINPGELMMYSSETEDFYAIKRVDDSTWWQTVNGLLYDDCDTVEDADRYETYEEADAARLTSSLEFNGIVCKVSVTTNVTVMRAMKEEKGENK